MSTAIGCTPPPLTRRHARATAWGAVASSRSRSRGGRRARVEDVRSPKARTKAHGRQPGRRAEANLECRGPVRRRARRVADGHVRPHQPTITVTRRRAASAGAGIGGTTQWSRLPSNVRSRFGRGAQSQPAAFS